MEVNTSRAEAERLLGIAEKLLQGKDFTGSRDFAVLAQETEPLLDGSDQILAVADVLLAAQRRVNNHHDWYAVLQVERRSSDDLDLIKKQYRRLAFLLHPDKNKFAFADVAFRIVAEAWAVISDPGKKMIFDNELNLFSKVDLVAMKNQRGQQQQNQQNHHQQSQNQVRREQEDQQQKLPVRRSSPWAAAAERGVVAAVAERRRDKGISGRRVRTATIFTSTLRLSWTRACGVRTVRGPFTRRLCRLCRHLCRGRRRTTAAGVFFPMTFMVANGEGGKKAGVPNWMPASAPAPAPATVVQDDGDGFVDVPPVNAAPVVTRTGTGTKKREATVEVLDVNTGKKVYFDDNVIRTQFGRSWGD
ncbi:chaperone DnaJ-domain superfamily protein [Actinidia rufa]|uniref:Chaperone DnaJ-domain superfamily protein n=1 Tax=Actinidia rufa TaxID=165716 RepID=A0A7J0DXJ0_9ERIC|nr:chaperone DnaJ-domain superfamily protein [Actinidia rufa]